MGTNKVALLPGGVDRRDAVWLVLLSAMLFTLLLPMSSYVAALPAIKDEWGLNNTMAGAVYSSFLVGFVLSALLVVPLTDRLGAPYILIGSVSLFVIAHILFPLLAYGIVVAALLRAAAGAGLVGVYMPGLRVIAERFSERGRGVAMGLFVSAFYAAANGSLAVTGALMATREWRDAYLLVALAAAVSLPMAYLLLRAHRSAPGAPSSGRLDLVALKNRRARFLILSYTLHVIEEHAVRTWLPGFLVVVLVARGMDGADAVARAATIAGVALAVGGAGPVMGGFFSDRWGRPVAASAIVALGGACAWIIGWTAGLPVGLVVAIAVLYGWAIAADSPVYSSGITEVALPGLLGSTMAMQAFLGQLGGVIGPIGFGGVLDLAPSSVEWGLAFSALGVLAIVSFSSLQRLRSLPQTQLAASGMSP